MGTTKADFIARLKKLAKERTAAARKAAEEESNRYRDSLDKVRDLSDKGSFADSIETLISRLEVSSDDVSFWGPRSPAHIREAFIQFCQVRKPIDFDSWKVVDSPDESLPDERNLTTTHEQLICCSIDECESRARDILDFVWMLAKVARNMKSVLLPRVIQLMVDFDRICGWRWWTTEEKAARLIDELIACWRLVMKEVSLLDATEVADIWPRRPIHEDDGSYDDINTDGMDAEEATEASRDQALEAYRREFKDLIPPEYEEDEITGEKVEPTHPMSRLVDNIKTLADEMESGEASVDGRWWQFDYALLERILSVQLELYYDSYDEGENGLDPGFCTEPTRESAYKKQIVADLDRYLDAAIKLAKSCESKSQDDWAQCRSLENTYRGCFRGYSKKGRINAAKDLKVFMTCLKRARQQLATDRLNYTPPPESKPIPARVVEVDKSAGKSLRTAMQDPGGRPKKTAGGAEVPTQAEMAVAFGEPCNEEMVANWEARAAGKRRGANPPDAIYKGERIVYSAELRLKPTPDNKNRLAALITEFQSRHRFKAAVGEKKKTIHCRSEESLYQARARHGA